MHDVEQEIRERAYHMWVAEGRQGGNELAHWLAAQREMLASSLEILGSAPAAKAKARKPKKAPAKKAKAA